MPFSSIGGISCQRLSSRDHVDDLERWLLLFASDRLNLLRWLLTGPFLHISAEMAFPDKAFNLVLQRTAFVS